MLALRDFWRRHRRKIFISAGVLGSGYLLYKLYDAHRRLAELKKQLAAERDEIKAQMQAHFENIQRIADTTTLPHAMHYLSSRIAEELDLSHLTERLMKGKGQTNTLTSAEKLELWDRLKILSFTRMVLSLWAMTMLSLYIRVQVNILGRHLYINTARGLGSALVLFLAAFDPFEHNRVVRFVRISLNKRLQGTRSIKSSGTDETTMMTRKSVGYSVDAFNEKNNFTIWQQQVKNKPTRESIAKALKKESKKLEEMNDEKWEEMRSLVTKTIQLHLGANPLWEVINETDLTKLLGKVGEQVPFQILDEHVIFEEAIVRTSYDQRDRVYESSRRV